MLVKTKGIVLHSLKYSENSIIIKMFTDTLGLQSFIIKSARSRKSRIGAGNFQPLSILEIVSYQGKSQGLQMIKEIISCSQFEQIPYDVKKSAVAFFMAELLYKSLREDAPNTHLFDFIIESVKTLDTTIERISDYHLFFMVRLSKHLGFCPMNNFNETNFIFNLMEGSFQERVPEHPYFADRALSINLHELLNATEENDDQKHFSHDTRKELILKLIDYYRIHVNGFTALNSNTVLEEVFS